MNWEIPDGWTQGEPIFFVRPTLDKDEWECTTVRLSQQDLAKKREWREKQHFVRFSSREAARRFQDWWSGRAAPQEGLKDAER